MAKVFVEGDLEALDQIAAALRSAGLSTIDIQFVVRLYSTEWFYN